MVKFVDELYRVIKMKTDHNLQNTSPNWMNGQLNGKHNLVSYVQRCTLRGKKSQLVIYNDVD